MMKIAVVGTGYVGLVTGTCFAESGNRVTCVDIDKIKVEKLSGGKSTIYEPGLEKIFLRNIKEARLKFTTQLEEAVKDAEIIFLALPTPPGADVDMVRRGIGSDDRIGKRFLFPGIGYGGSCFPKDVQALIQSAREVNYDFEILKAVEKVNANQKLH